MLQIRAWGEQAFRRKAKARKNFARLPLFPASTLQALQVLAVILYSCLMRLIVANPWRWIATSAAICSYLLYHQLRSQDIFSTGGDVFTLVLPGIGLPEYAEHVDHKILASLAEPFFINQHNF